MVARPRQQEVSGFEQLGRFKQQRSKTFNTLRCKRVQAAKQHTFSCRAETSSICHSSVACHLRAACCGSAVGVAAHCAVAEVCSGCSAPAQCLHRLLRAACRCFLGFACLTHCVQSCAKPIAVRTEAICGKAAVRWNR